MVGVRKHARDDLGRLAIIADYLERRTRRAYNDSYNARQARRGIRAWQLAPTIAIYEALMRGETVPARLLNPDAIQRYKTR